MRELSNIVEAESGKHLSLYGGIELPGRPSLENVRKLDLLPLSAISEMVHTGMAIDLEWFSQLSAQLGTEIKSLRSEICDYIPPDKLDEFTVRANMDDDDGDALPMNVGSTQQLSKLLFEVLGIGKGHQLKTTKSGDQISTGKKQLEKFKHGNKVIQKVLDYKERSKLKSAFADKLPVIARLHPAGTCWCGENHWYDSYRIHTKILSTRTTTGRLASKSPNLQQIPARSDLGRRVRAGFIPSQGMEMFAVDFGQFEMRLCAHYSQDPNFMRVFRQGLDIHTDTAMRAFGKTWEEVMTDEGKLLYRAPCKSIGFGLLYGLTPEGLYDQMILVYAGAGLELPENITLDWCDQMMKDWFGLYPAVEQYMSNQYYRAQRYGIVWTLLGRVRRIPEVQSVHQRIVSGGLRQAGNMPIQGTQADLNKIAIAQVHNKVIKRARSEGIACKMLMTVHDEIVGECEIGYGEIIVAMCEEVMGRVMVDMETGMDMCAVPILAEGHVMERWQK